MGQREKQTKGGGVIWMYITCFCSKTSVWQSCSCQPEVWQNYQQLVLFVSRVHDNIYLQLHCCSSHGQFYVCSETQVCRWEERPKVSLDTGLYIYIYIDPAFIKHPYNQTKVMSIMRNVLTQSSRPWRHVAVTHLCLLQCKVFTLKL